MSVTIAETVAHLRRMAAARAARGDARRVALEALLPTAKEVLRSHGAERVYVFGSVATGDTTEASDLDLAVGGLPGDAYFPALADLSRALPCEVDLVRLEEASASLRERIRAEGREV